MSIQKTLDDQGKIYGSYRLQHELRCTIMHLIAVRHFEHHGTDMTMGQLLRIYDIVNKVSRLAVTPDHLDSWHDIIGYATLTEEVLKN